MPDIDTPRINTPRINTGDFGPGGVPADWLLGQPNTRKVQPMVDRFTGYNNDIVVSVEVVSPLGNLLITRGNDDAVEVTPFILDEEDPRQFFTANDPRIPKSVPSSKRKDYISNTNRSLLMKAVEDYGCSADAAEVRDKRVWLVVPVTGAPTSWAPEVPVRLSTPNRFSYGSTCAVELLDYGDADIRYFLIELVNNQA